MDLEHLPITKITPNKNNPRRIDIANEDEKLSYLMDSIKRFGVMVPIVVTRRGSRYLLVDGERRFHAAKKVGLESLPAYVIKPEKGSKISPSELLYRMFQIHHLREQWGPIQQCFALEQTYARICRRSAISELPEDRDKYNAVVKALAKATGGDTRTSGDRVKFLRWPKTIKNRLYANPNRVGAYSYILEIEDKIIIPALSNYPEYFEKVPADEVRKDLFEKLDDSLTHAQEVRQVTAYFRAPLRKVGDKKRIGRILTKLAKNTAMTYEDAREELENAFPDIELSEPPTPKRLLGMLEKLDTALNQFDVEAIETATHRAKASKADIISTTNSLRKALETLLEDLEGDSSDG